jgi:amidohydrolase
VTASPADPSARIDALVPELVAIRRDLHAHPELGFEETRTQAVVRAFLERHGYAPRPCATTGLVVDVRPDLHGRARTIALRADLDCLPMDEPTALPWRSTHPGRAHKCGHDGHTAILLGTAALLAGERERLRGNVRLLFQPAEEGVRGGGAKVMVDEGALDGVAEVYGLHNWPPFPRGHVRVRAGAMLAAVHRLELEITGRGGHGSQPQACRDPIVAGAQMVVALQTVVSRGLGYEGGAVVSICRFDAGTTDNVIPERARLTGTIRTFAPAVTERVLARVREVVDGVASTFGVHARLVLDAGYPVTMNDPACAEAVRRVAERVVGPARVSAEGLPIAGAEDFAYLAQAVPGAYFFVGAGDDGGEVPGCHHPDFDFDDGILPTAIAMLAGIVADRLG